MGIQSGDFERSSVEWPTMLQRSEGQVLAKFRLDFLGSQRVKTGHRAPRVTLTRQRLRHQLFFGRCLMAIIVQRGGPEPATNPILSLNYGQTCVKLRPLTGGVWVPLGVHHRSHE